MCFYTQQTQSAMTLEKRFEAQIVQRDLPVTYPKINGFTFPKTPVITNENVEKIQHFQWGLIPFWAQDVSIQQYTLNAKIETLDQKPSFKNILNNRCLIIADGFFEWQWLDDKGKKKQAFLLTMPNHELFTFAGIWSEWLNKNTGELLNTYSIITTQANELMAKIHNSKKRMPLILSNQQEKDWLNLKPMDTFKNPTVELIAHPL